MANKFNIHWQIVRVDARHEKDPKKKLKIVLKFLETYPNIHNFDRILNWVKMTGVAYKNKNEEVFNLFLKTESNLEKHKSRFEKNSKDLSNNLTSISTEDLYKVYNDLKKRKYGFQYKAVPVSHIEFMEKLKSELQRRES